MARDENVNGANPGTQERHFGCQNTPHPVATHRPAGERRRARSPHQQSSTNHAASLEHLTLAHHLRLRLTFLLVQSRHFRIRMLIYRGLHFSTLTGQPHSSSTTTTSAPQRTALSRIRSPNTPLRQTITLTPGSTRLTNRLPYQHYPAQKRQS